MNDMLYILTEYGRRVNLGTACSYGIEENKGDDVDASTQYKVVIDSINGFEYVVFMGSLDECVAYAGFIDGLLPQLTNVSKLSTWRREHYG